MIFFLKKYKYTNLVAGALVVAVIGGACGAFVYKHTVCSKSIRRFQQLLNWQSVYDLDAISKHICKQEKKRIFVERSQKILKMSDARAIDLAQLREDQENFGQVVREVAQKLEDIVARGRSLLR